MIATMMLAAALAQPSVLAAMPEAELHGNRVELVARPAGATMPVFVDQLLAEAGATHWERMDRRTRVGGVEVRMVAVRNEGQGLILYIPLAENGPAVCRVVKLAQIVTPQAERRRIDDFCMRGIASQD